jgi:ribose transport system permease protein
MRGATVRAIFKRSALGEDTGKRISGRRAIAFLGRYGTILSLLGLCVIFGFTVGEYFLTFKNFINVLNQSAFSAICALGLTFVLASGEFDLSIGFNASLSGVLVVGFILMGLPIPVAIIAVIAIGALIGLFNGMLVTQLRVNALIATLGTGSLLVGINYAFSSGIPQAVQSQYPEFLDISIGRLGGIPHPVFYLAAIVVFFWLLLGHTIFGQNVQAVGGNLEAARLSGILVYRTKTIAFIIAGCCAALTGILLASSIGSGQPQAGDNFTLSSFAAAFLGTAVLREGEFNVVGTVVGVVTVAVGFNGLALLGVPSFAQFLFQGLILIIAVALSTIARRLSQT